MGEKATLPSPIVSASCGDDFTPIIRNISLGIRNFLRKAVPAVKITA